MNLSTLLDKIAGRHQQRLKARKSDFRSLVRQVADGKEPDPEYLDHVLDDNGKTLDDLRSATELLAKRRELRQAVDQKPKLAKERARIEQQIEEANQQLEAAETRHADLINPLIARHEAIRQAMTEADRAAHELERTCDYEELTSELASLGQLLKTLNTRRSQCELEHLGLRAAAKSDREEVRHVSQSRAADLIARADHRDARAGGLESELSDLRRKISEAEQQERAIRERMLEP